MNIKRRFFPRQIREAGFTTITAHSACEGTEPNSREHIIAGISSGAEYIEIDIRYDGKKLYLAHDEKEDPDECVSFDELLSLVSPYPTISLNCDVKTDGLLELVAGAAKEYGMEGRILFTGQCNHRPKECAALGADLWHSLFFLRRGANAEEIKEFNEGQIREAVEYCKSTSCPYINLSYLLVNEENIAFVKENRLDYSVWTVDDENMLRFLLEKRVANITTRKPVLALKLREEIQGNPEEAGIKPYNQLS